MWTWACALVLAGAPALARAAELELHDGASCASVEELSFRVSRALGQPIEAVGDRRFVIDIRRDARGFHAQLSTSGTPPVNTSSSRELNAPSCDEVVDALALAIALASSSAPQSNEPPRAHASPAPTAPPDVPAANTDTPSPTLESPAPSSAHAGVDLVALADTGSLPGAGFGAAVGARFGWPSLELRAQALLLPARETVIDASDPASAGGSLSLIAGALSLCTPLSEARVEVSACVGAELGRLSGTGTRVAAPHERHRPWAAARLELGARWPLPSLPLGLELTLTLAAPLLRDAFVLKDLGTVHQPPNVLGRAGLGLVWSFL
jgi:hypothetical protein